MSLNNIVSPECNDSRPRAADISRALAGSSLHPALAGVGKATPDIRARFSVASRSCFSTASLPDCAIINVRHVYTLPVAGTAEPCEFPPAELVD
jgi:hypothetical protein